MAAVCALHSANINCFHTFVLRRTSSEPGALARTAVSVGRHLLARELVLLAVPRMDAEEAETIDSPKNEKRYSREVESLRTSKNEFEFNDFEFLSLSFQRSRNPEVEAVHVVAARVLIDKEVEHVQASSADFVLCPRARRWIPRRAVLWAVAPNGDAGIWWRPPRVVRVARHSKKLLEPMRIVTQTNLERAWSHH